MNRVELLALARRIAAHAACGSGELSDIEDAADVIAKLAALKPAAYEIENDAGRNWFDYVPYSGVASLPLYNLTGIIDHE